MADRHHCCEKLPPRADLGDDILRFETHARPRELPEWQRAHRAAAEDVTRTVVEEECPRCKNPEMETYSVQMRSVDEGETVFYECTRCGYKFSVNN